MTGRFPNLLVIGAMKSGTTSLHDYLSVHPDIFMSTPKEIHYYADEFFSKWNEEKYKNFFRTDKKYAGTSPQSYTKCHNKYYQHIPERIHKDTPDVKLIYIVRDPIERYKSHVLESYYCDVMEDILYSKESGHYYKTSLYAFQLEKYLEFFSMKQIHIVELEELQSNPLDCMNEIFTFLGLEPLQNGDPFTEIKNTADSKGIPKVIRQKMIYRLAKKIHFPAYQKLARKFSSKFMSKQVVKPQLSEEEMTKLKALFREDTQKLRSLTNKKFDKWSI